jgi:hypothetical protein
MSVYTPHTLQSSFIGPTVMHLAEQFPHDAVMLNRLKLGDAHFCNLAERYHACNRVIHRIEAGIELCSKLQAEQLKQERLALLDAIEVMIEGARARFAHVALAARTARAVPAALGAGMPFAPCWTPP